MSKPHQDTHRFSEHHTSSAPTSNNMQPESQRSRFRYHLQTIRTSRGGAQTWKGAVKDLKIFFTDCWLDIVTLLVIVATAAGVSEVVTERYRRLNTDTMTGMGCASHSRSTFPHHLLHRWRGRLPSVCVSLRRIDLLTRSSRMRGRIGTPCVCSRRTDMVEISLRPG
jgi:hypothetical protein